jgi:Eukaryotic-type carbonic anhydrase
MGHVNNHAFRCSRSVGNLAFWCHYLELDSSFIIWYHLVLKPSILYKSALHPILKHLSQVKHAGDYVIIPEPVNFFQLLPCDKRGFYRYQASLTTVGRFALRSSQPAFAHQ